MKLEKNMYIRTKGGVIGKITNEDYTYYKSWIIDTLYYDFDENVDKWTCGVKEYKISKASHNIIDLIEVGDYVNGLQVIEVREHLHNDIEIILTNGSFNWSFSKNESDYKIKSIVTKEQFEQMQYKVGE